MSIKGFSINGNISRYDYNALDNKPAGGGDGLTEEAKQALLQCFQNVAYIDANGQTYYQALYDALYATPKVLTSIDASYTQSGEVLTTDTLDSLRKDIVVTAYYSDSTSATVTDYYLSGNLTAGTSTVTVYYNGLTDTISVTVTAVAGTYTISNRLTGCTTSNSATAIAEGGSYTATITASSGYTLTGATASVTMGGNTVTGAYSNGTISIANVTGDIVITVTAAVRTVSSISAVYTQSGTVYDTDTLDSLKDDLVVTANYSDSSTQTVPAADYTLSGTLAAGTSTITVSYGGKTTTFNVTVAHRELLFVGASYGAGTSGGTVTFNQDGSVRLASTGQTNWGLCFSPYGSASAFKTWGDLKGHTVRLEYKITWAGKNSTTRLVTAGYLCSDLSRYDATRLRYSNFFDTNKEADASYLENKEGYVDLLIPSAASGWEAGSSAVSDSNYFSFRTYLVTSAAGADVTLDFKFYDMGVLS